MVEAQKELKWVQGFLAEVTNHSCLKYPVLLSTDSQSAIGVVNNSKAHNRTKHFRRVYAFVRDEIDRGNTKLCYVQGKENLADFLTKNATENQITDVLKTLNVVVTQ